MSRYASTPLPDWSLSFAGSPAPYPIPAQHPAVLPRIRISLLPPFAPLKALLPLPADVAKISQLARYLHRSVPAIAAVATSGKRLVLEVDGFEVLRSLGVGVLREGDVVW